MHFSNVLSALLLGSGIVSAAHNLQYVETQISSYLANKGNSKMSPIGCHVAVSNAPLGDQFSFARAWARRLQGKFG